jgi:hypothetical protein
VTPSESGEPGGPFSAKVDTGSVKSLLSATMANPDTRCKAPMTALKTRRRFAVSLPTWTDRV